MTPLDAFNGAWQRCDEIRALHDYLAPRLTEALRPNELLRAEWVARVSALDLYVHEKVAQGALDAFRGNRPATESFLRLQVSTSTLFRVRLAQNDFERDSAFDLEIRSKLESVTYQHPDNIAEGIRLISSIELWNEIAISLGAEQKDKTSAAKSLKRRLLSIVHRRNKIAHEGDLEALMPRTVRPITPIDLDEVASFLVSLIRTIDALA